MSEEILEKSVSKTNAFDRMMDMYNVYSIFNLATCI